MNNRKLRNDEIQTLLDYMEDFVKAIVTNMNTPDVEDAVNLMNRKQEFFDHLKEEFGEREIDEET